MNYDPQDKDNRKKGIMLSVSPECPAAGRTGSSPGSLIHPPPGRATGGRARGGRGGRSGGYLAQSIENRKIENQRVYLIALSST